MSTRLFIGGMRGSQPATGGAFEEFGGDTTSLLVVGSREERLVLDAGTGMRAVAEQLARTEPGLVTVLFSHYHLDHMAGLVMNPLFYQAEWSFCLTGPTFSDGCVRDAVTRLLAPPYWPISWEQMDARIDFVALTRDPAAASPPNGVSPILFLRQNLHVRGCLVPHPGGCMAYRIDDTDAGTSLVFATDIEWARRTAVEEATFLKMCREPDPADVLVIDAHFAEAEKETFAGWGHTSWEDCLVIAQSAGIERVLLGHHAPQADDETLLARERQVRERMAGAALARAGQWIVI
ncbi:MAG: MBL fold metallo-hydrolase [Phycisphaerae bacterium]|nr:MBL fold metallo-hydrolase [Phycisphaerae bacterium]